MAIRHRAPRLLVPLALAFGLAVPAWPAKKALEPPVAATRPHTTTVHGVEIQDEYFWLRERKDPDVIRYLEAENAFTAAVTKGTAKLRKKLFREMVGRLDEADSSVPEKFGNYYYYARTEKGKQYRIHCRKKESLKAREEVILDPNRLATGHKYYRVAVLKVSPDNRRLAYAVDTLGSERNDLFVKDLETGEVLPERMKDTGESVQWANDGKTVFYTTLDETARPYRLYRHVLGTDPAADALVYQEDDAAFFLSIGKARSGRFLFMGLGSNSETEVWFLDADHPEGAFRVIAKRRPGVEYDVESQGESFYITTNEDAVNFRLMRAVAADPARERWEEVIPHRKDVKLDGVDGFRDTLVIYEREGGFRRVRIQDMKTGEIHPVTFDEPVYTITPVGNREYDTAVFRFDFSSLVTPASVFDYDMAKRTRELRKRVRVNGYNALNYVSKRLDAPSTNGVRVPISLLYRKGLRKDGGNPVYLYGYGAYGAPSEPEFAPPVLSLVDRGFVFAIAHVRGGGELGRPWYDDGKLLNKKHTFDDFIACAEHLAAQGYTSPDKLVMSGGSAGGLLIGAVANRRPDLFHVAVAAVPFVDLINTMLDPSLPLTVTEYTEWGDPRDKVYFDTMMSYSPYDNVKAQSYPDMLILAGLNDTRVMYWEPAKWTARLRARSKGDGLVLLKTEMGSGHGGASGRYDSLNDIAFEYAFILDHLGMRR